LLVIDAAIGAHGQNPRLSGVQMLGKALKKHLPDLAVLARLVEVFLHSVEIASRKFQEPSRQGAIICSKIVEYWGLRRCSKEMNLSQQYQGKLIWCLGP
jgi:hypothetical protein